MKNIFAVLFFVGFSQAALSQSVSLEWNLNLSAMESFLSELKNKPLLPERSIEASPVESTDEPVDAKYADVFNDLQRRVFGSALITLRTCVDCTAWSDYVSKTIYLRATYWTTALSKYDSADAQIIFAFIAAHEISHFVHEASIGHGSVADKSINGFVSLYNQDDFVTKMSISDILEADRLSHAEVDAYALLILHQYLKNPPTVAFEFLKTLEDEDRELSQSSSNESYKYSVADLESRIQRAKILMNKLWN